MLSIDLIISSFIVSVMFTASSLLTDHSKSLINFKRLFESSIKFLKSFQFFWISIWSAFILVGSVIIFSTIFPFKWSFMICNLSSSILAVADLNNSIHASIPALPSRKSAGLSTVYFAFVMNLNKNISVGLFCLWTKK